jgi:hypothetical protein
MTIQRHRGMTEQAADVAIDTACRVLRLPTIRARDGLLFAHFYTKVYDHVLRPLMAPDRPNVPPDLAAAIDTLDRIAVSHIAQARVPTAA